jgi:hypothetical protein
MFSKVTLIGSIKASPIYLTSYSFSSIALAIDRYPILFSLYSDIIARNDILPLREILLNLIHTVNLSFVLNYSKRLPHQS